jgi:proteasome accessory factor B
MPRQNPLSELKKVQRIVNIIRMISDPRTTVTINDIAGEFHVDRRTVNRDLALLYRIGFRLKRGTKKMGRKKVLEFEPDVPLAIPLGFTEDELATLYITREVYGFLKGSHFEKAADRALKRIEPLFEEDTAHRLRHAVQIKTGPVRDYRQHSDVIRELTESIVQRKCVKITYFSKMSNRHDVFVIHPYTLVFYSNALYVIGFSEKHNEPRTFAVERIGQAGMQARHFTIPKKHEKSMVLEKYFGIYTGEVQTVKIKVMQDHKKQMKDRVLHPSQKFSFLKDGSMMITLQVAGKEDLFRWILSQGEAVKLVAPAAWAKELAGVIRKMKSLYS